MTLPGEFSFSVPVLTSEATVNVFGSNVTSVTLTDPSGNKTQLDRDQDGNDLIAVFKDNYCSIKMICPKDGQWTCHVEGSGSASVLINSTDLQEMGLAIVANAASGNADNLAKNDEIHVSSYFAYKGHEIHNHSIYEQTHENAILRVRHSNGQTGEYKMEANEQGYFCDIKLNDFPCGTLDLQVVLTDGMFRNNEKRSETVTFKTIAQPLELTGNGPSDTLEAYVNSQFRDISLDIQVDKNMYLYYRSLQRYYNVENMYLYINDENNREIIRTIVDAIRDVAKKFSYDDASVAREIVKFVQDVIEYEYDSVSTGQEEYPRYPIETLYERQGDCEDTSILMAALLKEWGYEVGLLHLPGHAAVAIRTSDTYNATAYYEIDGHRYLFIESTGSGWSIGEIPDEFLDAGAELYVIP